MVARPQGRKAAEDHDSDLSVALTFGLVPIVEEPLEDFVAEEGELGAAGLAVGGEDAIPGVGADDLLVGAEQLGELLGVREVWPNRELPARRMLQTYRLPIVVQ